jgi:thioredoxin reductase
VGEARQAREVDVVVVGAGPAGLAVAASLAGRGAGRVEVLDREEEAGGIPRHSAHTGYGLRDLHRVLTGPAYARRRTDLAVAAGATVRTGVTVTGWAGPLAVDTTSPAGLERLTARAVVLATGARERPRPARLLPGTRPAGVWTTGQLQQAVLAGQPVGRSAVVVGAEHVSFSAVVTLAHAGVRVVAMVTDLPRHQSYPAFRAAALLRWGFPLLTGTTVTRLLGRPRLTGVEVRSGTGRAAVLDPETGVEVRSGTGRTAVLDADTVVLTGDWIPDHELARRGGLALDPGTRGPAVDTASRTSQPGVFAAGNLVHPVETADVVALEAEHVADAVLRRLRGSEPPYAPVPVQVEAPLAWVAPNLADPADLRPPRNRFVLWSGAFADRPVLEVVQGGRVLRRRRSWRPLVPNRPFDLDAGWLDAVDPAAGPVRLRLL